MLAQRLHHDDRRFWLERFSNDEVAEMAVATRWDRGDARLPRSALSPENVRTR